MNAFPSRFFTFLLFIQCAVFANLIADNPAQAAYPDPAQRFTGYVQSVQDADRSNPPPKGAIVCIGSSSMRGWEKDIDRDLYPLTLIKRGFGGSNFADALHYLDELVLPHQPRAVLVYEGDNDIGGVGVSPQQAFAKAKAFLDRIHEQLPDCRIYFISAKPSPSRWDKWPVMDKLNRMLAEECARDERLFFLDVGPAMLNQDGLPDTAIFKRDMLHMNRAGYRLWKSVIRPQLVKIELPHEGGQPVRLVQRWEVNRGLLTPESVYYHADEDVLFVSSIGKGAPADADGDGFISKISPDGKVISLKWATGLNAPKGIAVQGTHLYVTDVNELVRIDLKSGGIVARYPAEGAQFLNDVAADQKGNVFVSDSSEANPAIYRLEKGILQAWLRAPEINRPNGLSFEDGDLLAGNAGDSRLHRINISNREISMIADTGSRIDGLEPLGRGRYLVSNWLGRIALVDSDGSVISIQDTEDEKINAADFELVADRNLLVVPTFFDNRIVAYSIE